MKIALDTNAYSDLARGDAAILKLVSNASEIILPFVVIAELRAGFAVGTKTASNEEGLNRFLAKPNVRICFADEATLRQYAETYKQIRAVGRKMPTNDLWVAVIAIQQDAALLTGDAHFDNIPGLRRA